MRENIIKKKLTDVGNSKGILLPQDLLKQYGLESEVILEATSEGILIKPYKTSFADKIDELRKNKDKIYQRMKKQADESDAQAYYQNPENTPFADLDNEIL